MKLVIATGIFPPDVGGPATYSRTLAKLLARRGDTVSVVTYADKRKPVPDLEPEISLTRVFRSRFKPWNYFWFFRAVLKQASGADLIYAQGPVSEGYPAYLASRVLKKPLVVKVVGDRSWEQAMNSGLTNTLIDEFQTMSRFPPAIKRMRDIQKLVCKHAQAVITPSEYLKRIVIGWGIKPAKIKVVYNAIELSETIDDKEKLREKLGISEKTFLILSAGRNVPWKGFETLTKIVDELKAEHPEMELKILNKVPRQEFLEYARAADLFVLNTGYEGLSNILVEVLHMRTPIITTNVCGNPEIIKQGVNGLLVPYNNEKELKAAIKKLYSDQELRQTLMNNAAGSLGDKFQLQTMFDETVKELEACVS